MSATIPTADSSVTVSPLLERDLDQADAVFRLRLAALEECRRLTDTLHPGLDLGREIGAVDEQALGDTILLGSDHLEGFAVCHADTGSEAGPGACFVKFAAVTPGTGSTHRLARLLDAVEGYATRRRLTRLVAGVNTGRADAHRLLLDRSHTPFAHGVAMHRPNDAGYDRPDALVLDDGR